METETKKLLEQESKRPSETMRANVESLGEDDAEEIVTIRAPIATLLESS